MVFTYKTENYLYLNVKEFWVGTIVCNFWGRDEEVLVVVVGVVVVVGLLLSTIRSLIFGFSFRFIFLHNLISFQKM